MVFDKTGTLTERSPSVTAVAADRRRSPRPHVLALASAVEAENEHPIALAIRGAAPTASDGRRASRCSRASGVVGTVDGHRCPVGRLEGGGLSGPAPTAHLGVAKGGATRWCAVTCDDADGRGHRRRHADST